MGDFEKLSNLTPLTTGLSLGRVHARNYPRNWHHYRYVHPECHPVLWGANPQCAIRGNKEEVVHEKPSTDADDARDEAPRDDANHNRHHQNEGHCRDA